MATFHYIMNQQSFDVLSSFIFSVPLSLHWPHVHAHPHHETRGPLHRHGPRSSFPLCVSTDSSYTTYMLIVFELKITPEQSKTMISQYVTTSLITEQAKRQQKKNKVFFQLVVFIDDSVRCLKKRNTSSWLSSSFAMQSILTQPLPHNPVCCARYLTHLW